MGNVQTVRKAKKSVPNIVQAAIEGRRDLVCLFLKHGENINATCDLGVTALMVACLNGHNEVVLFLLNKGAQVNTQCSDGTTALMSAILDRNVYTVELLLSHGADVHLQRDDGVTALIAATSIGDATIVECLLLRDKTHIDLRDKWQQTALLIAIRGGHVDVAKVLIKHGASINVQDRKKRTPLMFASCTQNPDKELMSLLIQNLNDTQSSPAADQQANMESTEITPCAEAMECDRPKSTTCIPKTVTQFEDCHSSAQSMYSAEMCSCNQFGQETNAANIDQNAKTRIKELEARMRKKQIEIEQLQAEIETFRQKLKQVQKVHEEQLLKLKQTAQLHQCKAGEQNHKLEETISHQRKANEELQLRLENETEALEKTKQWCREQMFLLSQKYDADRKAHKLQYVQFEEQRLELESEIENKDKEIQNLHRYIASLEAGHQYENWDFLVSQRNADNLDTSGCGSTLGTNPATQSPLPSPMNTGQIHINVNLHGAERLPAFSLESSSVTSPSSASWQPEHEETFQILNDRLILDFSERLGNKFWELFPLLGISYHTLEILQQNNPRDLKRVIFDMFLKWRRRSAKPENEMVNDLRLACEKIHRYDLAKELQQYVDLRDPESPV